MIIGHADGQGGEAANQALGMRRAEAAKGFLVTRHQIDGNRIAVETRGSSEPAAANDTDAGRGTPRSQPEGEDPAEQLPRGLCFSARAAD